MAIFNSYVKLPEGNDYIIIIPNVPAWWGLFEISMTFHIHFIFTSG
jgi:hypothetical protein